MSYLIFGVVVTESVVDMADDGGVALPAIHPDALVREVEN
jgi:hypothetical protein